MLIYNIKLHYINFFTVFLYLRLYVIYSICRTYRLPFIKFVQSVLFQKPVVSWQSKNKWNLACNPFNNYQIGQ